MTATEIRYLDGARDMTQEMFDGHAADHITLGEGIIRGLLSNPQYIAAVYSYEGQLERLKGLAKNCRSAQKRAEAARELEKLKSIINEADGIPELFQKYLPAANGKYTLVCKCGSVG